MTAKESMLIDSKTPAMVATDFLGIIKDIEDHIENKNTKISEIENRGWVNNFFSSSRTDLIDISASQNEINEMMLGLIQEVITLNVTSYSFLAAVISEFEQRYRKGWRDINGRFQQLSDTGRQFADNAHSIFVKILDGSKSTQDKIALNQQNIEDMRATIDHKERMILKSSEDIDDLMIVLAETLRKTREGRQAISSIESELEVKEERLSNLDKALVQKGKTLQEHEQSLHLLRGELKDRFNEQVRQQTLVDGYKSRLDTHERWHRDKDERDASLAGQVSQLLAEKAMLTQQIEILTGKLATFEGIERNSRSPKAILIRNLLPVIAVVLGGAALFLASH